MKRVVVTGLGLVSPLGLGVQYSWDRLTRGESGISRIRSFDPEGYSSKIAGQFLHEDAFFDEWIHPKDQGKMGRFIMLGIVAAHQALEDANWFPSDPEKRARTGVLIGAGIGGLPEIEKTVLVLDSKGPRRVSAFFIPEALINLTGGHVSIRYGFTGPLLSHVTACATGTHAIGEAYRMIRDGMADIVVAGGAESAVCPIGVGGFCAMRALSSGFNDTPEKASRPWDKKRDGFVIGEGAGILVLEDLEHALARGATIHGEVVGYGLSGDAHHITSPCENGEGAYRCMDLTLKYANIDPSQVGYINAHGTSTPAGDLAELRAMERLFPDGTKVSSTKSSIGHLLGAAGSVEAIFVLMALKTKILPPTLNLEDPEPTKLDLIPNVARYVDTLEYALSNSFGFGGTNASVLFKAWPAAPVT